MTPDGITRIINTLENTSHYINREFFTIHYHDKPEEYQEAAAGHTLRINDIFRAVEILKKEQARQKGRDRCKHYCDTCQRMNEDGICTAYESCKHAKYKQKEWLHNRDRYHPYPFCRYCGRELRRDAEKGAQA